MICESVALSYDIALLISEFRKRRARVGVIVYALLNLIGRRHDDRGDIAIDPLKNKPPDGLLGVYEGFERCTALPRYLTERIVEREVNTLNLAQLRGVKFKRCTRQL